MYIRQISRKNKNGTVTRYVQLAHNERNSVTGTPQAKVLYHFGRADELDTEGLKRLAASIHRFIGEPLSSGSPEPRSASVTMLKSKALGGTWLLDQLWKKLGIGAAITKRLADREYRIPVERAIFAMVANRVLDPSSNLAIEDWIDREVVIPDLPAFEVQHGYRAMDFLLESDESIQREVFHAVADLLNLEVDLLFFDTTSTYFETEESEEDEFRKAGYSKDHRPDLQQVVIGFAVTRDGIPIRCWVWPGNTSDMSVVPEVKKDLIGWKLGRVITVADRGFSSKDNLRVLQQTGGHYIAGEKMTSGKPTVEVALAHPGRFKTIRGNLEVKEIIVGDGEARKRYVLVRNPEEAKRDAARREAHWKQLREELARLKELDGDAHTKAHCRLHSHVTYKRYLKIDKRGNLRIDLNAVKAMEHLDGKYLLRTSDDTLCTEDVAIGYKQLLKVEAAFRTLKQSLELRPVYHRKEERIRAHVLLCWLGLMLIRIIENQTGRTWGDVRSLMQMLHLVEYQLDAGKLCQRTELTEEHKAIVSALEIKEPQQIWDISLL
ncbi:IS1634 family transposase [Aneurinibacillus terranovensis]|uniref:IS1634 family transposase n=1 Tax=Aneurinibacillus terranovensis TaxID=278991 RepID=UPI000400D430|nr:IS1634 family transposase [Aneurinibacillus terranovensis]